MVMSFGTAAQVRATEAQMLGSYRVRHQVELLDYRQRVIRSLSGMRMSGSVQVNTSTEGVTRSLNLDLLDPEDLLSLGDGATLTGSGITRIVRVHKGIYVDSLGAWMDVPVFTGPITKPSRSGDILTIEAQDKASFVVDPRPSFTVKAGTNVATAIRLLMADCGIAHLRIASTSRKLAKTHSTSTEQTPWQLLQRICRSVNWVGFFDGAGYLVCRPRSTTPVATFRAGVAVPSGGVQMSYWTEEVFNRVIVRGAVISKTTITASATLPAAHPLSPESLAVGGRRWVKTEIIENGDISTVSGAKALAESRALALAQHQTTASFDVRPYWHLQEYDPFQVETGVGMVTSTVQEMTIPLDVEGMQAMGLNARSRRTKRRLHITSNAATVSRARAKVAAAKRREAAKKRAAAAKKRAAAAKKKARKK